MIRRRALLGAALAALALTACGKKTPPVAPERRVPAAVGDLAGSIREAVIELTWSDPTRRVDRTRLRDLALARVYRVDDDGRGAPKPALLAGGVIQGWVEVATIPLAAPAAAVVRGAHVVFDDRGPFGLGRRYSYVVVTADALGRVSPPSGRVSVVWVASPEAPGGLAAAPAARAARLRWEPPARLRDGSPVAGPLAYEVLRAPAEDAPLAMVGRTAAGVTTLTDHDLENDRTYWYAVRAVASEAGTTVYGALSARVAVTPHTTTTPSPPTGLVAIASEGAVRLSWTASPEPDVSDYVVYRAPEGGPFVRVGLARAPATTFLDAGVPRGTWRYVVTAEDASARRNESRPSNAVTVTVP